MYRIPVVRDTSYGSLRLPPTSVPSVITCSSGSTSSHDYILNWLALRRTNLPFVRRFCALPALQQSMDLPALPCCQPTLPRVELFRIWVSANHCKVGFQD